MIERAGTLFGRFFAVVTSVILIGLAVRAFETGNESACALWVLIIVALGIWGRLTQILTILKAQPNCVANPVGEQ